MKILKNITSTLLLAALAVGTLNGCKAKETFDAAKASFDIEQLYGKNWVIGAPMAAQIQFNNDGTAVFTERDGDMDYLLYTVNGNRLNVYEMDDDTMKQEDLEASFDVLSIAPEALQLKVVGSLRNFDLDDDLKPLMAKDQVLNLGLQTEAPATQDVAVEGVTTATYPKAMPAEEAKFDPAKTTVANINDLYKSWELVSIEMGGQVINPREAEVYTFDNQGNFTEVEGMDTDKYRFTLHNDEIAIFEADDLELEDVYKITKLTADELQLQWLLKDATRADREDQIKANSLLNFKRK